MWLIFNEIYTENRILKDGWVHTCTYVYMYLCKYLLTVHSLTFVNAKSQSCINYLY